MRRSLAGDFAYDRLIRRTHTRAALLRPFAAPRPPCRQASEVEEQHACNVAVWRSGMEQWGGVEIAEFEGLLSASAAAGGAVDKRGALPPHTWCALRVYCSGLFPF